MNLEIKELLSMLLDDALPLEKKSDVLKALKKDPALQRTWQIYHMIRYTLRNQKVSQYNTFAQPIIQMNQMDDKRKYH